MLLKYVLLSVSCACVRFGLSRSLSPPYHENRRKEKEIGRSMVVVLSWMQVLHPFICYLLLYNMHGVPLPKMERHPTQALSLSR
jgi:hypothetical protein